MALAVQALGDRCGLGSRSGAGVEDAISWLGVEQVDHELRCLVLEAEFSGNECRVVSRVTST